MKYDWKEYTVQELIDLDMLEKPLDGNHGSIHPKTSDYVPAGVPFIMANNLIGGSVDLKNCAFITEKQAATLRKGFAKPGDVLITHKATIGRTAIVPNTYETIILTPQVTYYRVKKGIDNRFLKYYFDSPDFQATLNNWAGAGSTRAYLGITAQHKLPVVLPPLDEQKKIANLLGGIDEKIENNDEINKNLQDQMEALHRSWFIDYAPFGGTKPSNWIKSDIYSIANIIYGAPFASKLFNTEGLGKPIIRIRDLKEQTFVTYTTEIHPKGHLIQPGDIVVGMDGEFRPYIWGNSEAWLNQRVCIFESKLPSDKAFMLYTIKPLLNVIEQTQVATTVIHIGKKDYDTFEIVLPDRRTLDQFGEITIPMLERIVNNSIENKKLAKLRDALLPQLMSGEIDVSDVTF
ncbi:restriction endonuclease subunit S [Veillonella atypica]|jgi:restriction endonuclease S subunits-like protein|uniref:restriction endonuclease subunit S n=1 Tax=Veillonella atypica TaxID=39777 RepID=UPI001D07F2DE|nr:restriction endonuclease subunit S [Veillonella atypica]MCB6515744.1 restriction endonuclease subunit S [Veillonella atypica]